MAQNSSKLACMSRYDRIRYRVQYCIHQNTDTPLDEIHKDTHVENDLAFDSLSFVEFLMTLDEEFDMYLNQEVDLNITKLRTVHDFTAYIVNYQECLSDKLSHPLLDANSEPRKQTTN